MSSLLINEPPLMVLPTLAAKIGLNEAIVLQQIHYWIDPRGNKNLKEGKHWVYNSYKDWRVQFPFWSEITIRRIVTSLEKTGLLISSIKNKNPLDKTKWYTIDYSALSHVESRLCRSDQNDRMEAIKMTRRSDQNDRIYNKDTETTTDITSSLNPSSTELGEPMAKRREKFVLEKKSKPSSMNEGLFANTSTNQPDSKDGGINNQGRAMNSKKNGAKESLGEHLSPQIKQSTAQMLQFWSETVGEGRGPIDLTPARENALNACLINSFKGDLDQWKSYCLKIASSKFLMGETDHKFKASLDWCVKETTVHAILDGKYTLGTREIPQSSLVPTDTETTRAIDVAEEDLLHAVRGGETDIPFKEVLIKRIQFGFEGPERRRVLETYGWERGGFSKLLETYISDMTFKASRCLDISKDYLGEGSGSPQHTRER